MSDISPLLIEQVQQAYQDGQALKIIGSDTKKGLISRDFKAQALHVGAHQGIVDYHPSELVLTARAGTRLNDIETALDDAGQMLTFEPPYFGKEATLGGTLACNLSGPSRPWAGSMRDMTLGVRLINGKGEHLRFGGQVMKNVAGYDASRLQAGALGSLGVITEISLKVLPKPEKTTSLVQELSEEEALKKMSLLCAQAKPLSAATWVAGKLYLRLSGSASAVDGTLKQWGGDPLAQSEQFWTDLREQQLDFFRNDQPLWRFSIKPTTAPLKKGPATLIDWAGAQRWVIGDFENAEMEKMARQANGHVSLFKGGDRTKDVHQSLDPLQQKIQHRLKQSFDPKGILNPGSLYSWM